MQTNNEPIVCVPGQRLCLSDKINVPGPGTYEQHGYIYSKLAGVVNLVKNDPTCTVEVHGMREQSIVPAPGDVITAMVMLVNQRFCKCVIKCIGDVVLTRPYRGILRKEDVRATEKDKTEMYKSFRPGDIILARVGGKSPVSVECEVSSASQRRVLLSHAMDMNHPHMLHTLFFVIPPMEGISMVPVSWTEMQCPKTLNKEFRKVAKVVPEHVINEK